MSFVQPCRIAVSDRAENEGVKVLSTMLFPKTLSEKPETKYRKQKKHIIDVLFKKKSVRRGAKGPEDLC